MTSLAQEKPDDRASKELAGVDGNILVPLIIVCDDQCEDDAGNDHVFGEHFEDFEEEQDTGQDVLGEVSKELGHDCGVETGRVCHDCNKARI